MQTKDKMVTPRLFSVDLYENEVCYIHSDTLMEFQPFPLLDAQHSPNEVPVINLWLCLLITSHVDAHVHVQGSVHSI